MCQRVYILSNKDVLRNKDDSHYDKIELIGVLSKFMEHLTIKELNNMFKMVCRNPKVERLIDSKIVVEVNNYYKSALGEVFHIFDAVYGGDTYYLGKSKECLHKFDAKGRCSSLDYLDWLVEISNKGEFDEQQKDVYSGGFAASELLDSRDKEVMNMIYNSKFNENNRKDTFGYNSRSKVVI